MATRKRRDPGHLRRRQPLLGDERRLHTPPRPEVRRPRRATRRRRRQAPRYVFDGGRLHPIIPGPGDVHMRPTPGALYDYFAGTSDKARLGNELSCEDPAEHPEWFDRDARLRCMDEQGVEAAWLFPSQGVCMEGPMQPDIEASIHIFRAFNRWLDDDWGFAYQNRIFAVPFLTLSDVDQAVEELDWCLEHGARVVSIRNGPAFTPEGTKSPADPMFDPFWARVAEARVVVAPHAGFEDGYVKVTPGGRRGVGPRRPAFSGDSIDQYSTVITMLMKHRLVHDFAGILVADKLFERHPGLRSRVHRERRHLGRRPAPRTSGAARSEPRHVPDQPGRPVPRALLGRALRGGQRPRAGEAPPDRTHPVRLGLAARRRHGPSARLLRERRRRFPSTDQRKIMVDNARDLTLT